MAIPETRSKIISALSRYAETNTSPDGVMLNHKSADYAKESGWVYIGFPRTVGEEHPAATMTVHLPDYMWENSNPVFITLLELILL